MHLLSVSIDAITLSDIVAYLLQTSERTAKINGSGIITLCSQVYHVHVHGTHVCVEYACTWSSSRSLFLALPFLQSSQWWVDEYLVRPAQGMQCTCNAYCFVSRLSLPIIKKTNAWLAGLRLYQNIAFRIFLRDSPNKDSLQGKLDLMSYSGLEMESDELLSSNNLQHSSCVFVSSLGYLKLKRT